MTDKTIKLPSEPLNKLQQKAVDLRLGQPHHSLFPTELLDDIFKIPGLNQYYHSFGDKNLREQLINRYYRNYTVDNIIITNGGIGALDLIFRTHLKENDHVLIPTPGFPPYEQLVLLQDCIVKKYTIDHLSSTNMIDWESFKTALTINTKLVLINSPHNPTGKMFTSSDKEMLVEILSVNKKIKIIIDEVYRDIILEDDEHINLSEYKDRVIIVGSFSKMFPIQGARIGWVLANKYSIDLIKPYVLHCIWAVSSFGQEVAKRILDSNIPYNQLYRTNYKCAVSILDEHKIEYLKPHGTFFLYLNTNHYSIKVCEDLNSEGVKTIPGASFGDAASTYLRVSLSNTTENVKEGITRICRYINARLPHTLTAGNYIARFMETRNVNTIFGVSGANIEDLLFSAQKNSSIKIILAKNEYNACTMAIGAYLKTNKVQYVYTTSGGGFLNTIPIIAEAYTSRIPYMIISGQVPTHAEGQGGFQDASGKSGSLDIMEVVRPITAYCAYAHTVDEIEHAIESAYQTAVMEKRPCVVFIPKNLFTQEAAVSPRPIYNPIQPFVKKEIINEIKGHIEEIDLEQDAFFIIGEESNHLEENGLLSTLIQKHRIPIALTNETKGSFDNDHYLYKGLIGIMGHDDLASEIENRKYVFMLGCQLNATNCFGLEKLLKDKKVFVINGFPTIKMENIADITYYRLGIEIFLRCLDEKEIATESTASTNNTENIAISDGSFSTRNILLTINEILKANDDIFVDAGNTGAFSIHYLKPRGNGVCYVSLGMGGMGNSIGSAIGSAFMDRNNTYVFVGDGSFLMQGFEIQTALEHSLPITFFLFNNNSHGMCTLREKLFNDEFSQLNNLRKSTFGELNNVFEGLNSYEINTLGQLDEALSAIENNKKVNLLSLNISRDEIPPFKAFINKSKHQ